MLYFNWEEGEIGEGEGQRRKGCMIDGGYVKRGEGGERRCFIELFGRILVGRINFFCLHSSGSLHAVPSVALITSFTFTSLRSSATP